MRKLIPLLLIFCCTCSTPSGDYKQKAENPEFIHRSLKAITDRIVHDIFSPPVASRIYTYASVAAYEAIIHHDTRFKSMAGQLTGLNPLPQPEPGLEYCYPLAATTAMLTIGRAMIFSEAKLDEFHAGIMKEFQATGIPDDVSERSIEFGKTIAQKIMEWSASDNYKQTRSFPKYSILSDPQTWKPTPPAYMDAVEPHWSKIRPFVIDSAAQFKPTPPTSFSAKKNSPFYMEADEVYQTGVNLTQEQRSIASFWDCNPFVMNVKGHVMFATKKISPGGHWMNITRVACTKSKAGIVESTEAYARVALSLVDGFISCWDEKYRSKLIRPESYINQFIDENWVPLLQTPPFPEYTSGHSVISSSAAVALTGLFGDKFAFTDSTEVEFGMPARSFTSFVHASEEAAISRMYGGIHYRPAVENGWKEGTAVGNFILGKVKTRNNDLTLTK